MSNQPDGVIVVDSEINAEGFKKDSKELEKAVNSLSSSLDKIGDKVKKAFSGKTNTKELDAGLRRSAESVESLKQKLSQLKGARLPSDEFLELEKFIEANKTKLNSLIDRMYKFKSLGIDENSKQWKSLQYDIDQARGSIKSAEIEMQTLKASGKDIKLGVNTQEYQELSAKLQQAKASLGSYSAEMKRAQRSQGGFFSTAKKGFKSVGDNAKKTANKVKMGMGQMILSSVLFSVTFKALAAVTNGVKEGFENLAQYSGQTNSSLSMLMSSLTQLKNSFAAAFAPILSAVAPILSTFINLISKAVTYVGMFFAALTGQNSFSKAVEVQQDYAESLKETGSAAKKAGKEAEKSLAQFDQLNPLTEQKDTDSSGGGDAGKLSPSDMFTDVPIDNKVLGFIDMLKEKLQPTIDALGRLKQALEPLKTFAFTALYDFYNNFLVPIGNWFFGEGLPRFIDAISQGLLSIDWGKINGALLDLWNALAPFAINVGEGLLWLWENVLVPLAAWTISDILPIFLEGLAAAFDILNNLITVLQPLFQWLWDSFLQPLAEWTGGLIVDILNGLVLALTAVSDWIINNQAAVETIAIIVSSFAAAWVLVNGAIAVWNSIGAIAALVTKGFGAALNLLSANVVVLVIGAIIAIIIILIKNWDTVKDVAIKCWEGIKNAWNAVATWFNENVIQPIVDFFTGMWDAIVNLFTGVVDGVVGFFQSIWDGVKNIFNTFNNFLSGLFKTDFSKSFGGLGDVINSFFSTVKSIWDSIKQVFDGIIKFVTGVFTGNWSKAWEGVKSIFSGIVNGLGAVFKAPLNAIIGLINGAISGLNMIRLPSWVPGIGGMGINIPKIPYLATGTVVPPNAGEFAAVLGDNKRETEVVSPLSTMKQALKEAFSEVGGVGSNGGAVQVNLYLDGQQLLNTIIDLNKQNTRRTGKNAFAAV